MKKPPIGARVRSNSYGEGTVIDADDCEVIKKHPNRSQKWRDQYVWVRFTDGSINGWSDMNYLEYIPTLEDKVEAARQALAEAEAELAASKLPNPGDRYSSAFNGSTATVKAVVDDVIYYEYVSNRTGTKDYTGRVVENFLKTYETKLCDC